MQRWQKFSEEEIREIVENSKTYPEIAQKLGYNPDKNGSGEAINAVKNVIKYYGLNDSHIRKLGWNKEIYNMSKFKKGTYGKPSEFANPLIQLRGYKCECCGNSEWLGKPIKLEVHHIDGDHYNNELENLQLLCPNCHSMTPNWRGKNNKKVKEGYIKEEDILKALEESSTIRQALLKVNLIPYGDNYTRAKNIINKYGLEKYQKKKSKKKIDKNNDSTTLFTFLDGRLKYSNIKQLDKDKNIINNFDKINDVLDYLGIKHCSSVGLKEAINNNIIYRGYYWEAYKSEINNVSDIRGKLNKVEIPSKQEILTQLNNHEYSAEKTAKYFNISSMLFKKWCNNYGFRPQQKYKIKELYKTEVLGEKIEKKEKRPKSVKIAQIEPENNSIIKIFNSKAEVEKYLNLTNGTMGLFNAIKKHTIYKGYYWEKLDK